MPGLRFLFDVGVGKLAEETIANDGHDVLAVRDLDPAMTDLDILRLAAQQGRIVVTMDTDFGELVFRADEPCYGVLLLRTDDAPSTEKTRVAISVVREHGDALAGSFAVFARGRLRIHPLRLI